MALVSASAYNIQMFAYKLDGMRMGGGGVVIVMWFLFLCVFYF